MTSVNAGEVLYITLRECGEKTLAEVERILHTLPITIVDADMAIVREAVRLKAFRKMSYADCIAAALGRMKGAAVVTGDPEFHAVEKLIKIKWL